MMICTNAFTQADKVPLDEFLIFLRLLNPFAPHIAEQLQEILAPGSPMLYHQAWPEFDAEALIENEIELVVQVNGKLRDRIAVAPDANEETVLAVALASPKIKEYTDGKSMRKVVYVQGRLLNLVVG